MLGDVLSFTASLVRCFKLSLEEGLIYEQLVFNPIGSLNASRLFDKSGVPLQLMNFKKAFSPSLLQIKNLLQASVLFSAT